MDIHCLSWFSNDRSTAKEIDHVLVNTRWSLLRTCRVYRSLEFESDHMAVVATLTLRPKRLPRLRSSLRRFNVIALRDEQMSDHFHLEVSNRFAALHG